MQQPVHVPPTAPARLVVLASGTGSLLESVLAAAVGVFGTGQAWPDLLVAAIMAALAIWGAADVFLKAKSEIRGKEMNAGAEVATPEEGSHACH